MGKESGILDTLDPRHGVRQFLADDEIVVHVSMTSRQLRGNHHAIDEIHSARGDEGSWFNIPVARYDPWPAKCTHYGGCLLEQRHVFSREPFAVAEVDGPAMQSSSHHCVHE